MKLPKLAIENFQFTAIFFILLTLVGLLSLFTMPRSEDPQVSEPTAAIVAVYPGASPVDLEQLVIDPIEEALNELDELKDIRSSAEDGLAVIRVEFRYGEDPDEKFDDVVQKINSIRDELPEELVSLEMNKFSISNYVNIFQLALQSDSASYRELDAECERLKKRLEKISGIKKVRIFAVPEQQVHIRVDLEKLARMRISLSRIVQAIRSSNANIPGGYLDVGARRFDIKTSGSFQSLADIRNTVVDATPAHVVYLKDVAEVAFDEEDIEYLARLNGRRAVFVTATQKEKTNIFAIMQEVRGTVDEFAGELPESITVSWVFDQSKSVARRLNGFLQNLAQGVLLVGFIMWFVLGARASLLIMLVIPASILIGMGVLDLNGFGIQQMSITGLVISLGLLVDNAIVVIENVSRFIRKGHSRADAAVLGTSQIGWAVASSTATTVLAFVPIIFMQNVSGEFIRSMPLTVVYTLLASLLLSLTLTPYLASRFLRVGSTAQQGIGNRLLKRYAVLPYRKMLVRALAHPGKTLAVAFGAFAFALAMFPLVGVSFFPKAEKAQFIINLDAPKGSNLRKTDALAQQIEAILLARPEIDHFTANVGHGNPVVYYNLQRRGRAAHLAQFYVELKDHDVRRMRQLIAELRAQFATLPDMKLELKEFEQGPPVRAPVEIYLLGENLDALRKIAGEVESIFVATRGTVNINNPIGIPKTRLKIAINREKAGMLGVGLVDIDRTIRASISGLTVSQFRDRSGEEEDIVVRLQGADEPKVSDLDRIFVESRLGREIPLRQLASLEFESSPMLITHYNLDRSVTISADVLDGYSVDRVTREILARLQTYDWPPGYSYSVAGELEKRKESFGGMLQAIFVAMIAIFGVLVLQFKSFSQPLIVFAAIPLALVGAILALLVTGNSFSFTAFVGLTSLVGIVVNNSIILVDYTNQLRHTGVATKEAILQAGETRFMPILLTTATTVGGLLPLTLIGGTMWAPMGWTIIGGLLVSTMLTLIVVPVLYQFFTPDLSPAQAASGAAAPPSAPGGATAI